MKYRFLALLLLVFFISQFLSSQQCNFNNTTFKASEELTYIISYNWFFVWTDVGEIKITIKDSEYNKIPTYLITGFGATYSGWDWFFKVRDTYKCHIDKKTMKPLYFSRQIQEGKYTQFEAYEFNQLKKQVITRRQVKDYPWVYDTVNINNCVFDVLSAYIYSRNIDFKTMKPEQTTSLTILLDQELYDIYFRYIGNEKVKVRQMGKFNCLKFSLMLIEGAVFKEGENMNIWVTNDKNCLPVYIESPILVGTVKARLSNVVNNRHSITSVIK